MQDSSKLRISTDRSLHRVVADAIGMRLGSSGDAGDGALPPRWAELLAAMDDRSPSPAASNSSGQAE